MGESTLALDEEMLQVLDAVESVKPASNNACSTAVKIAVQEEPESTAILPFSQPVAPVAEGEGDTSSQPTGQGTHRATSIQGRVHEQRGDCKRPGGRADCKDLAQRLLFSDDLEEAKNAQRGPENTHPSQSSARINELPCQEIKNHPQVGSSAK